MDPVSGAIALAPLLIEYVSQKQVRVDRIAAEDFRKWIAGEGMDSLFEQFDKVFETLVRHQAVNFETLTDMSSRLAAVHDMVSRLEAWARADRNPLKREPELTGVAAVLFDELINGTNAINGEFGCVESKRLPESLSENAVKDVSVAARLLEELGYAAMSEYSGYWYVRLSPAGYLRHLSATGEDGACDIAARIRDIIQELEFATLADVVDGSGCDLAAAQAFLCGWEKHRLVEVDEAFPIKRSRVSRETERLPELSPNELVQLALKPPGT